MKRSSVTGLPLSARPMGFTWTDALAGLVLAYLSASVLVAVMVSLMGQASPWPGIILHGAMWTLPSIIVGGILGIGFALGLADREPWKAHVTAFALLGAACGVVQAGLIAWLSPLTLVCGAIGATASTVGYVAPMLLRRRNIR